MTIVAVPITVLTGFLGSGKTTLLNRLLHETHGRQFAVIENEFGAIGVDAALIARDGTETIVQLTNGCICCTVRGDLARTLGTLARRRAAGEIAFDHVLIETTGLADPGALVRTFLAETALLEKYYLDGVVTLVDALHGGATLDARAEARAQVACADCILVTKADQAETGPLAARLAAMNPAAGVHALDLNEAGWEELFGRLLDLRGYQFDRVQPLARGRMACDDAGSADAPNHAEDVTAVAWETDGELDGARLDAVLTALRARYPALWRIKGVLCIRGSRRRLVLQGVQGLWQINPATVWRPFEPRRSALVLIGQGLDRAWIVQALQACAVTAPALA